METIGNSWEVVFVNDGSHDQSSEVVLSLALHDAKIKMIELSRNFGQQVAVSAGIEYAGGEAIVLMDVDLQDPPEFIPQLIEKYDEGFDVVYAIRKKRKEHLLKRMSYFVFYRILRKLSNVDIPQDSGDFCVMGPRVVEQLKIMPERNRFVRGMRSWVGFKQTGLECERDERFGGAPKNTYRKLLQLAIDGFLSFSITPLRISAIVGAVIAGFSFVGILVQIGIKLFDPHSIQGFASTKILILFLSGVQLFVLGVIGEYLGRVYDEIKQRPLFIVKQLFGFSEDKPFVEKK